MDPNDIVQACAHLDRALAGDLVDELIREIRRKGEPYSADLAQIVLDPLRRKRYFDLALPLADVILESGQHDPAVRQFYLQALLDTGRLDAAIPYAEQLIDDTKETSPKVHNASRGLLGRAYKQLYVNGAGDKPTRDEYLRRSFQAYYEVYDKNPKLVWQGINAVAVLHRGADDGVQLPDVPSFEQGLYDEMRKKVEAGTADEWGLATAGEAAIALGDTDSAIAWYAQYAENPSPYIDAFELNSSLRQLIEVWRLSWAKPPGKEILPMLRGALLKREGGELTFKPRELAQEENIVLGNEATFDGVGSKTMRWYAKALRLGRSVCRIERTDDFAKGTGFIVRGKDFHKKLGDELMVLTNHHVINKTGDVPGTIDKALRPGEAQARFMRLSATKRYAFDPEIVWTDPTVDATLVRFKKNPPEVALFPFAECCPKREKNQNPPIPAVYIIHHPGGGELSITFRNNELVATNGLLLHYRASTERGSSGSPVFDDDWNLVGLHHRGLDAMPSLFKKGENYEANEAFWIGAVRDACKNGTVKGKPRKA